MLIAHHWGQGMQIAPAAQLSAAQNTADGGRTEPGTLRNLIRRTMLTAELNHPPHLARRSGSWTAVWTRGAVAQSGSSFALITANPLGGGFLSHVKALRRTAKTHAALYAFNQRLSTAKRESGILMDVHSVGP